MVLEQVCHKPGAVLPIIVLYHWRRFHAGHNHGTPRPGTGAGRNCILGSSLSAAAGGAAPARCPRSVPSTLRGAAMSSPVPPHSCAARDAHGASTARSACPGGGRTSRHWAHRHGLAGHRGRGRFCCRPREAGASPARRAIICSSRPGRTASPTLRRRSPCRRRWRSTICSAPAPRACASWSSTALPRVEEPRPLQAIADTLVPLLPEPDQPTVPRKLRSAFRK